MPRLLKNHWFSARGLKRGLLLSLLASLAWITGVYSFMQAQEANQAANPYFKMTQVSFQLHNDVCETKTL